MNLFLRQKEEKMEKQQHCFSKLCLVCLKEGKTMHSVLGKQSILDRNGKKLLVPLYDMLVYVTSKEVLIDGGPHLICKMCSVEACTSYKFKKRCNKSRQMIIQQTQMWNDVPAADIKAEVVGENIIPDVSFNICTNDINSISDAINKNTELVPVSRNKVLLGNVDLPDSIPQLILKKTTNDAVEIDASTNNVEKKETKMKEVLPDLVPFLNNNKLLLPKTGSTFIKIVKPDSSIRNCVKPVQNAKSPLLAGDRKKCKVCNVKLLSQNMRQHMHVHVNIRSFACAFCPKKFAQKSYLMGHLQRHKNGLPCKCKICSKNFDNISSYKMHVSTHNNDVETEVSNQLHDLHAVKDLKLNKYETCPICQQQLLKESFKRHIRTHNIVSDYTCSYCNKKFTQKPYLKAHIRRHDYGLPCICQICKKSFAPITEYTQHMKVHVDQSFTVVKNENIIEENKVINEPVKPPSKGYGRDLIICTVCGEEKRRSHIKHHMMIHNNIQPYACVYCSRKFNNPSNLKVHMRIHTGLRPYECKICGRSFSQWSTYNFHLRVHQDIKPFKCHICPYSTRTNARLKLHINRHEGVKNYHCAQCDYASCTKSELIDHVVKHSDDKCFLCKICGKGFSRRKNLRGHEKSHEGIKKWFCDICEKRFTQKHSLKSHLTNVHSAILH